MSNHVLFEIGVEELPARFIDYAEEQLKDKTEKWLQDNHLEYKKIKTFSTPRRLAIQIHALASEQTTITEEVRGPQEKIAKDENGNWTKAAIGFTKGQGKQLEDIYVKELNGISYIFVENTTEGKRAEEILPNFSEIISAIAFPQTMRWGSDSYRFARPIRWLVALLNDKVIPFEVAHVKTNNITYGHRFLGDKMIITDPLKYESILENNYVIPDAKKRESMIVEQIKELENKEGFQIAVHNELLQEVRNLVEYPTVFFGKFAENYLELPSETLITSMAEHQRYFPVYSHEDGTLLSYFVGVRNGDKEHIENVVKGNEKVLRARLKDAEFFYDEDRNRSIDYYLEKLKTVVFQDKIGTIYEKTQHVVSITEQINRKLQQTDEVMELSKRAAEISKFDLVTDMVNEFPELQGIMGEKYALHFGEKAPVAAAVKEHYFPIQANGELPKTVVGSVVSVSDKLDTIIGCISVGLTPTGSQDPYGLRRQAIGILRILSEQRWEISVEELVSITENLYEINDTEVKDNINSFLKNRAAYILSEHGIDQDVVQAVLAKEIGVFHYTIEKAKILSRMRNDDAFRSIQEALVRVMNLGKKQEQTNIEQTLFRTDSEKELYNKYVQVKDSVNEAILKLDAEKALVELGKLTEEIHSFFEHTMVMVEEENIKNNRLALVHVISNLIEQYADMTLIEWKQHK
ncbi:glycine--tRNA ligase subunit beta [Pseudogracilibacillus sp. SO30301A]|uniref:glycine--tRNA ligase subunit beta n=1 Tax=Pseudogracilibacillus sp. SO30301A TaxID=3098291 RepID=UPI00300E39A8